MVVIANSSLRFGGIVEGKMMGFGLVGIELGAGEG